MAGKATLTIDSSILATLDARMDASSTQGLAAAGRLTAKSVDWMIFSSHGLALAEDIAVQCPKSITPQRRRRRRHRSEFGSAGADLSADHASRCRSDRQREEFLIKVTRVMNGHAAAECFYGSKSGLHPISNLRPHIPGQRT